MQIKELPIAIIGGGPVGLAAAANLSERNIPFIIFESGSTVGSNMLDWGHVRMFTPWKYTIDKSAERLLIRHGWIKPNEDVYPTGKDMVEKYLIPLANLPQIKSRIQLSTRVTSISKKGIDKMKTRGRDDVPFVVHISQGGETGSIEAAGIIDASGTWKNPSPMGSNGLSAIGEMENMERISYRIPDILGSEKNRYTGKNVAVIGAGHSALNSLLDLAKLASEESQTKIHWIVRSNSLNKIYGGKENDALSARGALGTAIEKLVEREVVVVHSSFFVDEIAKENDKLVIIGKKDGFDSKIEHIDEIIVNTGSRPELSMLREVRAQFDPALECVPGIAEMIDPNIHSCGTVRPHGELELRQPEKNFYIVGMKSYGRAPTFLLLTGYEQVRSIVASIAGDTIAARKVELVLPETGVCNTNNQDASCGIIPGLKSIGSCCSEERVNQSSFEGSGIIESSDSNDQNGCCGGEPAHNEDACCKLDEQIKSAGGSGCGCNDKPVLEKSTAACC
jgi:thioredoxin reductase